MGKNNMETKYLRNPSHMKRAVHPGHIRPNRQKCSQKSEWQITTVGHSSAASLPPAETNKRCEMRRIFLDPKRSTVLGLLTRRKPPSDTRTASGHCSLRRRASQRRTSCCPIAFMMPCGRLVTLGVVARCSFTPRNAERALHYRHRAWFVLSFLGQWSTPSVRMPSPTEPGMVLGRPGRAGSLP